VLGDEAARESVHWYGTMNGHKLIAMPTKDNRNRPTAPRKGDNSRRWLSAYHSHTAISARRNRHRREKRDIGPAKPPPRDIGMRHWRPNAYCHDRDYDPDHESAVRNSPYTVHGFAVADRSQAGYEAHVAAEAVELCHDNRPLELLGRLDGGVLVLLRRATVEPIGVVAERVSRASGPVHRLGSRSGQ